MPKPVTDIRDSSLYKLCYQASTRGRRIMNGVLERTRVSLMTVGARQLSAVAQLDRSYPVLLERFGVHLLSEFTQALQGADHDEKPTGNWNRVSDLSLLDEGTVQEQVEVQRARQAARNALAHSQPEMDALISALQGFSQIWPERNPFRSDVYVQALQATVVDAQVDKEIRMAWLAFMGEALGQELVKAFAELREQLVARGVRPLDYTMQSVNMRSIAAPAPAASGHARGKLENTLAQLKSLLGGGRDADGLTRDSDIGASRFATDIGLEDALIASRLGVPLPEAVKRMGGAGRDTQSANIPRMMVAELLETVSAGAGHPQAVVDAVRAMEPSLLRIAQSDPMFLTEVNHPARTLVAEIAKTSLSFESTESVRWRRFVSSLRQVASKLNDAPQVTPGQFQRLRERLTMAWEQDAELERADHGRAMAAMNFAQRRVSLAHKITPEVLAVTQRILGTRSLQPKLKEFLFTTWCEVVAEARLSHRGGRIDPGGRLAFIADLIWLVQPDSFPNGESPTGHDATQVLAALRVGLKSIDFPVSSTNELLRELMGMRQEALKRSSAQK